MKQLITFKNAPCILSKAAVVGRKEMQGPLSKYFDASDETDKFGKPTFEQAESEMQRLALETALKKAGLDPKAVGAVFAGDLANQCTGSSYGLSSFGIPFFGLYGACSTMAEGLMLAALTVDRGVYPVAAAVASSHNSAAERQFRYPLEYGSQRPPSAQWTVTAAAAFVLGESDDRDAVRIVEAFPGKIVDMGITDQSDMGAAMAPAAAQSIADYLAESGHRASDFDMILTGDLGKEGHALCRELLARNGVETGDELGDCGMMIFDGEKQDTHSGGSGCGCSGAVLAGYVMEQFRRGRISDVLLCGTGALMSPSALQQGLSIAGIGHIVRLKKGDTV